MKLSNRRLVGALAGIFGSAAVVVVPLGRYLLNPLQQVRLSSEPFGVVYAVLSPHFMADALKLRQ